MAQSGGVHNRRNSPGRNNSEKKKLIMLLCMVGVMVVVWLMVLVGPSALVEAVSGGGTEIETPVATTPTAPTPQEGDSAGGARIVKTAAGEEIEIPSIQAVDELLAQSAPPTPASSKPDRSPFAIPWKTETSKPGDDEDDGKDGGKENGDDDDEPEPTTEEVEAERNKLRERLSVSGIIYPENNPEKGSVAYINDLKVRVGESISIGDRHVMVRSIMPKSVVLSFTYSNREYELTLDLKEKR